MLRSRVSTKKRRLTIVDDSDIDDSIRLPYLLYELFQLPGLDEMFLFIIISTQLANDGGDDFYEERRWFSQPRKYLKLKTVLRFRLICKEFDTWIMRWSYFWRTLKITQYALGPDVKEEVEIRREHSRLKNFMDFLKRTCCRGITFSRVTTSRLYFRKFILLLTHLYRVNTHYTFLVSSLKKLSYTTLSKKAYSTIVHPSYERERDIIHQVNLLDKEYQGNNPSLVVLPSQVMECEDDSQITELVNAVDKLLNIPSTSGIEHKWCIHFKLVSIDVKTGKECLLQAHRQCIYCLRIIAIDVATRPKMKGL